MYDVFSSHGLNIVRIQHFTVKLSMLIREATKVRFSLHNNALLHKLNLTKHLFGATKHGRELVLPQGSEIKLLVMQQGILE